jgi:hypothetical protein
LTCTPDPFDKTCSAGSENLEADCGGKGWALIEWKHGRTDEPTNSTTGQETLKAGAVHRGLKTAEELGLLGTSLIIVRPIQKPPSQVVEEVASLESSEPEIK